MRFDGRRAPALLLAATTVACWPVWIWYARHLGDSPDDVLGVAALVLLLALSARQRRSISLFAARELLPSTASLALYAASLPFVPRLVSAVLAFAALGFAWSLWRHGTPYRPWAVGLAVLGLPMASSLQFYLGYPLRVASGAVAVVMLRAGGTAVALDGVTLRWGDTQVLVDAPCSGVRMLWAAVVLGFCLAALLRLRGGATVMAAGAAALLAVIGNGLRTTALFWADTNLPALPELAHGGIGLGVFALMAAALVLITRGFAAREGMRCAPSR